MGISIPQWYPYDGQPEMLPRVSARESWIELRAMRSHPPRRAVSGIRSEVFRAAMEQSEQLFRAAENTGYESRPLLLFYGLSQAGRAIAAASHRLNETEWALSGHGIRAAELSGPVAGITVSNQGSLAAGRNPSFLRVAQALASPSIPEKVGIRELWYLIPELRGRLPISRSEPHPALFMEGSRDDHGTGMATAHVWGFPADFTHTVGFAASREYGSDAEREIVEYVARYPSLASRRFVHRHYGRDAGISWEKRPQIRLAHDGGLEVAIALEGRLPVEEYGFNHPSEFPSNVQLRKASFVYPSLGIRTVLPAVGGNTEPLHPLITWWAVLYGLSMLARYEPSSWTEAISVNRSAHAVVLEVLLDEAANSCPPLILQCLESKS